MAVDFKIIIITLPTCDDIRREAADITAMLRSGAVDFVHIRKPDETTRTVRALIEAIPQQFHCRLRLHGHFVLLNEFNLAGAQLGQRCPEAPKSARGISRSCHSTEELENCTGMDYATLSPVFLSISKPGYHSATSLSTVPPGMPCPVIALGGVTPSRFEALAAGGYSGAAMLGWMWDKGSALEVKLRRITMMLPGRFRLQYITDGKNVDEVEREVARVLEGGCRWVHLRIKDTTDDEVAEATNRILPLCRKAGALLLLDDRVEVTAATGADGVHLGKGDMRPDEARRILGEEKIIGSTANSFTDILEISRMGASDYLGVGPLRFTTTKKRLAPTLGIDGYREIFAKMDEADISLPVVAIGGITPADVSPLLAAGAKGVAVSGDIRRAPSPSVRTREYLSQPFEDISK